MSKVSTARFDELQSDWSKQLLGSQARAKWLKSANLLVSPTPILGQ